MLLASLAAYVVAARGVGARLGEQLTAEQLGSVLDALRQSAIAGGAAALVVGSLLALLAATVVTRALLRVRDRTLALARQTAREQEDASARDHTSAADAAVQVAETAAIERALDRFSAEVRLTREQVTRERDDLRALLQAVGEGILQLDGEGRVVRVNAAARALLGLPAGVEGQHIGSLVRRSELRQALERAAAGESVEAREIEMDERCLMVAATPLPSGAPGVFQEAGRRGAASARPWDSSPGTVAVIVDLTELRRLESVRRDFVANASHELKTPLTSIRGYTETLLGEELPDEIRRQFLKTVRDNAERLQRIVDDLLDLSRLESGGWRPEIQRVDLVRVVERAWAGFAERAQRAGVAFRVAAAAAPHVLADPVALEQIFANLFDNALRYTASGGEIRVRLSGGESWRSPQPPLRVVSPLGLMEDDAPRERRTAGAAPRLARAASHDWILVEVQDTGSGIPRDALERIFERFYRADPARSRDAGGTGLGLAIVKHLLESMGGDVEADSELGMGTTIRFRLPQNAPPRTGSVAS